MKEDSERMLEEVKAIIEKSYNLTLFLAEKGTLDLNPMKMFTAFYLSKITSYQGMDKDEGNRVVQECLYKLGMESTEIPLYLDKKGK